MLSLLVMSHLNCLLYTIYLNLNEQNPEGDTNVTEVSVLSTAWAAVRLDDGKLKMSQKHQSKKSPKLKSLNKQVSQAVSQ